MTTSSTIKRRRSPSPKTPPPVEATANGVNMSSPLSTSLSKTDSQESDSVNWDDLDSAYINPFTHRINIDRNVDLAKVNIISFFFFLLLIDEI